MYKGRSIVDTEFMNEQYKVEKHYKCNTLQTCMECSITQMNVVPKLKRNFVGSAYKTKSLKISKRMLYYEICYSTVNDPFNRNINVIIYVSSFTNIKLKSVMEEIIPRFTKFRLNVKNSTTKAKL